MNRRQYLFLSSGAAIGSLFVTGKAAIEAQERSPTFKSGLVTGNLKPLRYDEVPGFLSAEQIAPHHSAHYGGALRAFNSVQADFDASYASGEANYGAAFNRMKFLQSSRGNSVLLHELYFDGIVPTSTDAPEGIRSAITKRFGSVDRWAKDFVESAKTAAGWAMLVVHPVNGKLYNVVSDEHAQGPMWLSAPLIVIDVYEHAFYIDYQNRKGEYIEKFLDYIDWGEAERRYRQVIAPA